MVPRPLWHDSWVGSEALASRYSINFDLSKENDLLGLEVCEENQPAESFCKKKFEGWGGG